MILKFFDIFLKMKDLSSSEAFMVMTDCSPEQVISELQSVICHRESHSVTFRLPQVNTERTPLNPSQTGQYWINIPQRDGRLSWPRWLVTYWDDLSVRRQSPIQLLTRSSVEQLCWWRPMRHKHWPLHQAGSVLECRKRFIDEVSKHCAEFCWSSVADL